MLGMDAGCGLCGELAGDLVTRRVDETLSCRCPRRPTLDHVSRILVMRVHCQSVQLSTTPTNPDPLFGSADMSESVFLFASSSTLHITLH